MNDAARRNDPRMIDVLTAAGTDDIGALLAPEVRFRSPYADYRGRAVVAHLLGQVCQVLDDLRVDEQLAGAGTTMSRFEARIGDEAVQGVLTERRDGDGHVVDAMLTLRPYAGLIAAMRAMRALLDASPLPGEPA